MAIAFDAVSNSGEQTDPTNPLTFSHTCTGSDLVLLVFPLTRDGESGDGAISAITYNGVSMTQEATRDSLVDTYGEVWSLTNPATGANDVSITFVSSGTARRHRSIAISYTGVDQSTSVEASNTATGNSTTPSVSVTTLTDNAMVVDGVVVDDFPDSGTLAADGSQTERLNINWTGTKHDGSSEEAQPTAGATSMDWMVTSANDWVILAVALKPVAAAGGLSIPVAMNSYRQRNQSVV